jgi:hypothetical protein
MIGDITAARAVWPFQSDLVMLFGVAKNEWIYDGLEAGGHGFRSRSFWDGGAGSVW